MHGGLARWALATELYGVNSARWVAGEAGPAWPVAVQTVAWGLRPVALYDWCARRYGKAFTLRILGSDGWVHFSDADAIREIFEVGGSSPPAPTLFKTSIRRREGQESTRNTCRCGGYG
jgi:hypothetical protein